MICPMVPFTVTLRLKVTVNGTIGQIIHDLVVIELFDGEYYRDLEMWVRGQSRSLKMAVGQSSLISLALYCCD